MANKYFPIIVLPEEKREIIGKLEENISLLKKIKREIEKKIETAEAELDYFRKK